MSNKEKLIGVALSLDAINMADAWAEFDPPREECAMKFPGQIQHIGTAKNTDE